MKPWERARASTSTRWGKAGMLVLLPAVFFLVLEWQEHDYATNGETVKGVVLDKGPSRSSRVSYRFSTHDVESLEGSSTVLPARWDELQPGASVTIEYKRDFPRTSRITGQTAGAGFWWKAAVLLGGAGFILILIGVRKAASTGR